MSLNPPPLPPMQPTWGQYQVWWQQFIEQLKGELGSLAAAEAALAAAVAAQATANTAVTNAATAQTTANTGVTNAATAQTTADTVKRDSAIGLGWTSPGTVLSALDNGTNVTITIAAHVRKYGDGTSVNVTGNTLTVAYGPTTRYVYYNDSARAGGAVTFLSSTDPNVAQSNAATGRHRVGSIDIPASGGAATSGGYTPPGGYTGPGEIP